MLEIRTFKASWEMIMLRKLIGPLAALLCLSPAAAWADGAVYAMTNALGNNEVLVYHRAANGNLSLAQTIATGGAAAACSSPASIRSARPAASSSMPAITSCSSSIRKLPQRTTARVPTTRTASRARSRHSGSRPTER